MTNKYIKHFLLVCKHKWYVGVECFKHGLYWQGIVHDLSKFSSTEFFTSARYFQGNRSPIGMEKLELGYSYAWINHKNKNKHHWEYWTDFKDGKVIAAPMPTRYVMEMVCDMIGATKAYGGKSVLDYYNANKANWHLHPVTKYEFESLLKEWDVK